MPRTREQIPTQGWQRMRGELILPLAVLKQLAPQHNLCGMRDCCARRGLLLAPHGKTNVYPQQRQMEPRAGA